MDDALFLWWDALPDLARDAALKAHDATLPEWMMVSLRAAGSAAGDAVAAGSARDDLELFLGVASWWLAIGSGDQTAATDHVDAPEVPRHLLRSLVNNDRVPGQVARFRHPSEAPHVASTDFPHFVRQFIVGTQQARARRPQDVEIVDQDRQRAALIRTEVQAEAGDGADRRGVSPGATYPVIVDRELQIDDVRSAARAEGRLWHLVRAASGRPEDA